MKWFYELPKADQDRLTETVWNPTYDAVLKAMMAARNCGPGAEVVEIATEAAKVATHRAAFPFRHAR